MFVPIHRTKPNCQIIQKGTKFLLFRCFFRYIGRIKIPHFGVFVPIFVPHFVPCLSPSIELLFEKIQIVSIHRRFRGDKNGDKICPLCPLLSPFVPFSIERLFVCPN